MLPLSSSDVYMAGCEVLMGIMRFEREAAKGENQIYQQFETKRKRQELVHLGLNKPDVTL